MAKNIFSFNDFKGKKSVQEVEQETLENKVINEMVDAIDDFYRVSVDVDLPKSLISSFIKKVKETSGRDLRADMGEKRLAERLVQWANENYLTIENLPVEIVTGTDKAPVQAQAQAQAQAQELPAEEPQAQAQPQAQPQVQPQAQPSQAQPVQVQAQARPAVQVQGQQKAQATAAQVPAQEI
jgi:glucan-binding YG repeat protein